VNDIHLRLILFLVTVLASLIGAACSMVVFFWIEARRRYLSHLTCLRSLILVIEIISAHVENGEFKNIEFKSEWFIYKSDNLVQDAKVFDMVRRLVSHVSCIQRYGEQEYVDFRPVLSELNIIRDEALLRLKERQRTWKRLALFTISAE
jgi:hypothetical protein